MSYSSELKEYLQTLGFRRECCMMACTAGFEAAQFEAHCEHCLGSFLRGVFFRFGYLNPPEKDAMLTFTFGDDYALYVQDVLRQAEIEAKIARRRGKTLLYIKKSDAVSDLVSLMGATRFSLRLMEVQVDKQFRGELNRKCNAETANLARTANAAAEQLTAIERLKQARKLGALPEELQAAAALRLAHPEASLEELRRLSDPPVSRSGLNHRLQKLTRLASELTDP
ncbi:MAG: DNA-binding protein WhiA [Oscillospiraceae bacterium]|nr:DNA-binding protein WhiA [Oscillospiraceae bacterium]